MRLPTLTPKTMRILSHLEQQPSYGKRIADTDPACFTLLDRDVPLPGTIYQTMNSLERRGLIERIHNYVPNSKEAGKHPQTISRAVWYRLTDLGFQTLTRARLTLQGIRAPRKKRRRPTAIARKPHNRRAWNA